MVGTGVVAGRTRRSGPWSTPASRGALFVAITFAASRLVYHACGVRFDWSTIGYFSQLVDPTLLRSHLGQSLFYLHAQPPLYNLLTGIVLKVAPQAPGAVLWPLFLACGLYTGLCLYVILLRLRVPTIAAALVASAIVVSPPFVIYENWYFYPHLNVMWLVGSVAWLAQSRGRPGREMVICAAHLAGLSLTRSLFHPLFFVLVSLLTVALVAPGVRRRAALCFAVPGVLVLALCVKNQILFGFFGTSSWSSRNVFRSVTTILGPTRTRSERRLGRISPAITINAFDPGDRVMAVFGLEIPPTGIPALDAVYKVDASLNPANFNHRSYPPSARLYARDVRDLIAAYPLSYLRGLWKISLPLYFHPVDEDNFFSANRHPIARAARWFAAFDGAESTHWVLAVGLALAVIASLTPVVSRADRVVVAFAILAIAWITCAGVVGEIGENSRFRYKGLWLAWVIAVAGYAAAIRLAGRIFPDPMRALRRRERASDVSWSAAAR
jgi:hypothetical protein